MSETDLYGLPAEEYRPLPWCPRIRTIHGSVCPHDVAERLMTFLSMALSEAGYPPRWEPILQETYPGHPAATSNRRPAPVPVYEKAWMLAADAAGIPYQFDPVAQDAPS